MGIDRAEEFGRRFEIEPIFSGNESHVAILSNAAKSTSLFGPPSVCPDHLIKWIAQWIANQGAILNKPTHFEVQDGKF